MPTVRYLQQFEDALAEWEALPADEQEQKTKPVIPPKEMDITITYPDTWTMGHKHKFLSGQLSVPEAASWETKLLYGTTALIDTIEGIDLGKLNDLPLHFEAFFDWMIGLVYLDGYFEARYPKKKQS